MSKSWAELRKSQSNSINKLQEKVNSLNKSSRDPTLDDDTYWDIRHVRGADGTGFAKVRLLPAPPEEDDPFVKYYEYAFKGPTNKWYINKARNSLGPNEADPAYEYNGTLFNDESLTDDERKKKLVKRNTHYVVGVKILQDPNAPENVGKVKKWRIGPQIWKLIEGAISPEFEDKSPVNVFDPIDGADFNLRVYTKTIQISGRSVKVPSYEKSDFSSPAPLCEEDEFDTIWNQQYSLKSILDPKEFKSYEQLSKEFNAAMGVTQTSKSSLHKTEEPKKGKEEPSKSLEEDLDDKLPWVEDNADSDQTDEVETSNSDDDDWFAQLKS